MSNRPLRPQQTPLFNQMGVVRLPVSLFNQTTHNNNMTLGSSSGSMNALLRYSIQRAPGTVSYQTHGDVRPVQFTSISTPGSLPHRLPNILTSANIRPAMISSQLPPRALPPNSNTRPIQPAKQQVQRKTLAFSQVELFQSDVYTEKKTRAFLPAIEKAPLRPIADILEDLGRSMIKRSYPDILDFAPPPDKKRRTVNGSESDDDDYIPESSSDSSSSNDEADNIDCAVMFDNNTHRDLVAEKFHLKQLLTDKTTYKCNSCNYEGSSRFDLDMHYHHGHVTPYGAKLQISCCLCDYIASDSAMFNQHVLSKHQIFSTVSHSGKTFACHYCNSDQATEHNMNIHLDKCAQKFKLHENLKPFGNDSNYLFRGHSNCTSFLLGSLSNKPDTTASTDPESESNQRRDRGSSTQLETLTGVCEIIICELCNGLLSNVDSLFQHFVLAHNAHISDTTKRLRIKPFECTDCLKEFWTPIGLFYHRQMKKDRCPVGRLCPYCHKVSSISLIYKHIESQHKSEYDNLMSGSDVCLVCQNSTDESLVQTLSEHLAKFHKHGLNSELKCPMCAFVAPATNSATHLRDHMIGLSHHYLCKKMPRCLHLKFSSIIELERHQAFSHILHVYFCEFCGKESSPKFFQYEEYARHVQEHIMPCSVKVEKCKIPEISPLPVVREDPPVVVVL